MTRRILFAVYTCLLLLSIVPVVYAGGGPENVAIVVNADSWASKSIANEYIAKRGVPAANVIYLDEVPGFLTTDVETFRERILRPALQTLNERGMAGQIDYFVYSTDFPYAINVRADIGSQELPRVLTPVASINGLTYLYGWTLGKDVRYLSLRSNGYFRRTRSSSDQFSWPEEEQARYERGVAFLREGRHADAERALRDVIEAHPRFPAGLYNLACSVALQGRPDEAMSFLDRAVASGWSDEEHTLQDEDLASLRGRADFQVLIEHMRGPQTFTVPSSIAFDSVVGFSPEGEIVEREKGMRYLISTMLAYTSGRGTSVEDAVRQLRQTIDADFTRPDGTFYFMRNGNVRSTTREWALQTTVETLRNMGLRARIVDGSMPRNARDIVGLMTGAATLTFDGTLSRVLPGAICEHLTSFGGVMRANASQTPLSVFIRAGAGGASGTVTEPFAIQQKFPDATMHVHYARGSSLGEAFYQSVEGPYQLLIVGDALAQPWASPPPMIVRVNDRELDRSPDDALDVRGPIRISARPARGDSPLKRIDLYFDGRFVRSIEPEATFTLDPAQQPRGWHTLQVVGIEDTTVEAQRRVVVPINVVDDRHGATMTIRRVGTGSIRHGETVALRVLNAPGDARVRLVHNAREVATLGSEAGEGLARIETTMLGPGPVTIQAVADDPATGKLIAVSRPLDLVVGPPEPIPPLRIDPKLADGPVVRTMSGDRAVVKSFDGNWLSDAGIDARGVRTTLEAIVIAREKGLHQLQMRVSDPFEIRVNGQPVLEVKSPGGWQYVPLHFEQGIYRLEIDFPEGVSTAPEFHEGMHGTAPVDASRWLHIGR